MAQLQGEAGTARQIEALGRAGPFERRYRFLPSWRENRVVPTGVVGHCGY